MKIKYLLSFFLFVILFLGCEKKETEFRIKEIKVSKSVVEEGETVQVECIAVKPSQYSYDPIWYHWEVSCCSNHLIEHIEEGFGVTGKCGFFCGNTIQFKPSSDGPCTIEVLAYLPDADHFITYGNSTWYVYYDSVGDKHCFTEEEKGELWDLMTISITVTDN